jgi:hypothetical protein
VRYAKVLADRGAKVVVEAQREVVSLIARASGVWKAVAQTEPLPDHDFQLPMLSLPFVFGTRPDSIPAETPYLFADPARSAAWRERIDRYGPGMKVGIAWAGSPQNALDLVRSVRLADYAPLAQIPNLRLFSLQKGVSAMQVFQPIAGLEVVDFAPFLNSFEDTAAAIANLDLVISVDTSIVHLAGAMARPVWTLIPFSPDWRWLLNRSDTPWYPTMRLFRQPALGDWATPMQAIVEAIRPLSAVHPG